MDAGPADPFLFVATPTYGGMCHTTFTSSLIDMVSLFCKADLRLRFGFVSNESLITRARDGLVYDFLHTDCTHLLFIDSDIGFRAEDILSMIAADKEIICGLYPAKTINWQRVADAARNGVPVGELDQHTGVFVFNTPGSSPLNATVDEPTPIRYAGCGFMLIQRGVLEDLADDVPSYQSLYWPGEHAGPKVIKQFFTTSIDADDGLLSEDYHFCKLARDHGYTIWAAPWAVLSHTGSYQFTRGMPS